MASKLLNNLETEEVKVEHVLVAHVREADEAPGSAPCSVEGHGGRGLGVGACAVSGSRQAHGRAAGGEVPVTGGAACEEACVLLLAREGGVGVTTTGDLCLFAAEAGWLSFVALDAALFAGETTGTDFRSAGPGLFGLREWYDCPAGGGL